MRKCQILTNLANYLNNIGRFVEAIEIWSKALSIEPQFAIALGNRGHGYIHYANALYSDDAKEIFSGFAHLDLSNALSNDAIYCGNDKQAKTNFQQLLEWIESLFESKDYIINARTLIEYDLGSTDKEKKYRKWCLDNILFLNALNDIQPHSVAAVDSLVQPPIISSIKNDPYPPPIIGFFSQIKQEYVTARWMYYNGITNKKNPFF